MPAKERIQPEGLSKTPNYSHVVLAGNTVYVAGQTASNEKGEVVGVGDIEAQAVQVFENIKRALSSVNATFDDLVKINVYITDRSYREPVSKIRSKYLTGPLPASTLIICSGLANPDYLLEIEVIAVLD